MYILSSTERLFRCIITLRCGLTRETLKTWIETHQKFTSGWWHTPKPSLQLHINSEINAYVLTFVLFKNILHDRIPKCSIHKKSFALREWQPLIPSPKCSTPTPGNVYIYMYIYAIYIYIYIYIYNFEFSDCIPIHPYALLSSSCHATSADLPDPTHTTLLYGPSLPVGFQGYNQYRHWAVVYRF